MEHPSNETHPEHDKTKEANQSTPENKSITDLKSDPYLAIQMSMEIFLKKTGMDKFEALLVHSLGNSPENEEFRINFNWVPRKGDFEKNMALFLEIQAEVDRFIFIKQILFQSEELGISHEKLTALSQEGMALFNKFRDTASAYLEGKSKGN